MKRGARHRKKARMLAKTLIATSLTAGVAGIAGADTVTEVTDFGDDLASVTKLPIGTTEVFGSDNSPFGEPDFFEFSNLVPNQLFTLVAERTGLGLSTNVGVLDSSGTFIAPPNPPLTVLNSTTSPVTLTGQVPANGILVFEASGGEGVSYHVTLRAAVPEPSTLALTALGAALSGVFARRRRKARGTADS